MVKEKIIVKQVQLTNALKVNLKFKLTKTQAGLVTIEQVFTKQKCNIGHFDEFRNGFIWNPNAGIQIWDEL